LYGFVNSLTYFDDQLNRPRKGFLMSIAWDRRLPVPAGDQYEQLRVA
jgi:hypothetical protein